MPKQQIKIAVFFVFFFFFFKSQCFTPKIGKKAKMYILINLVQLYEESSTQCNKASKKKKKKERLGGSKESHRSS